MNGPEADFALVPVDLADLARDELLVEVAGSGICHTDLGAARDPTRFDTPMVFGHEGAGRVVEVGDSSLASMLGRHVVLSFDYCGTCALCLAGTPSYCRQLFERNLAGTNNSDRHSRTGDGRVVGTRWFGQSSWASHAVVTRNNAIPVDDSLPLDIMGPLGCSLQTGAGAILQGLDVRAGASVLVVGAGAVGLAAVMGARAAGANRITAVEPNASRRRWASDFGAHEVLESMAGLDGDVTHVKGQFDYAVDTSGSPEAIMVALAGLNAGGACALLAPSSSPLIIEPMLLTGKSVTFMREGNVSPQLFIPRLVSLWQSGLFPLDEMMRRYPLRDIATAVSDLRDGSVVKPILGP